MRDDAAGGSRLHWRVCDRLLGLSAAHTQLILAMALDTARIKALCFDIDGTLSNTDDQMVASLSRPLSWLLPKGTSRSLARKVVMRLEGPGNFFFGLPDRFGIDDELTRLKEQFLGRWLRRGERQFELIDGVLPCLERCVGSFSMAVITARGSQGTEEFLNHFSLHDYFTCVASALTAARSKPYPDPIFWAADQMNIAPESCLMIGDTTVDIRAGTAAGAQTVGVLSGFGEAPELLQAGADLIIDSVADLPRVLTS